MKGQRQAPTPEQLAEYARTALFIEDMAMDAGSGTCYLLCKVSRLEIKPVIIAVDSAKLASLAITYIQVAQAIRDAAIRIAAGAGVEQ
jgi:hypothetical protein